MVQEKKVSTYPPITAWLTDEYRRYSQTDWRQIKRFSMSSLTDISYMMKHKRSSVLIHLPTEDVFWTRHAMFRKCRGRRATRTVLRRTINISLLSNHPIFTVLWVPRQCSMSQFHKVTPRFDMHFNRSGDTEPDTYLSDYIPSGCLLFSHDNEFSTFLLCHWFDCNCTFFYYKVWYQLIPWYDLQNH